MSSNASLVAGLVASGVINSARVEAALSAVDRALFVLSSTANREAYVDAPLSIGHGVTISAPHMHAHALQQLLPAIADKEKCAVLDVGSGSGYLVAALAALNKHATVLGVDVIPELVDWSRENLRRHDPSLLESGRVEVRLGDGWKGDPGKTYDAIHVGAAAETVPDALVEALKPNGRMVIPVGKPGWGQQLMLLTKDADGKVETKPLFGVAYVPLVKAKE